MIYELSFSCLRQVLFSLLTCCVELKKSFKGSQTNSSSSMVLLLFSKEEQKFYVFAQTSLLFITLCGFLQFTFVYILLVAVLCLIIPFMAVVAGHRNLILKISLGVVWVCVTLISNRYLYLFGVFLEGFLIWLQIYVFPVPRFVCNAH